MQTELRQSRVSLQSHSDWDSRPRVRNPGSAESASEVARFIANHRGAHQAYVVISALLAIPIAVFFVGVHRTLAKADREHGSAARGTRMSSTVLSGLRSGGPFNEWTLTCRS